MQKKHSINELKISILDTIKQVLHGDYRNAYQTISSYLDKNKINLLKLSRNDYFKKDYPLFRIRKSSDHLSKRSELFHIPFSLRQNVQSYRYSIAGLPCLYLGGSAYVCWEELNKPNFNDVYISQYLLQKEVKLIDFGIRPAYIAAHLLETQKTNMKGLIVSVILFWPLIFACSIKKKYKNTPFVYEYILPQLILQWVTHNTDIDGIRYFSTNVMHYGFPH